MQKISKKCEAFIVEKLRDQTAVSRNKNEFLNLYTNSLPEIRNLNTSSRWDALNLSDNELLKSLVYLDKVRTVLRLIGDTNRQKKLLNVGFGDGFIETYLENLDLHGIDISPLSVRRIRKRFKGDFRVGNILNIPFKRNSFDIILCLDVMEHISPKNTFRALSELNRTLNSKGLLIVSVPLNENLEEMVQKGVNPNAHVRVYTPNIIKMELELSGFIVKKEIYLSAFSKYYYIKKFINSLIKLRQPNLLIIIARKK